MGLKLRVQTTDTNPAGVSLTSGVPLTYAEGDSNFIYLLTNMSGSNVRITGSTGILGSLAVNGTFTLLGLSPSSGPNVIMYNTSTGQFFYQSTSSVNVGSASYVSSSKVDGPFGLDSIRSASYASGSTSASYALSASYAFNSTSASYALSSSNALSSSYALTAAFSPGAGAVGSSLTQGTGIVAFSYNGGSAQTVAVAGAASLTTNLITKWNGSAFANASLTDNGTTITGTTSIQLTGASSNLSGSFSGSFTGNGANLTGVTATPSFPSSQLTNLGNNEKFFINDDVGGATSGNKYITYANLLTDLAGTNLAVGDVNDSLTLATTITGLTSVTSTSFTGSLSGNASTASTASFVSSSFMKAGAVAASAFSSVGGDPYIADVIFSTPFSDNSYAVTVTGEDARSWTIQSKSNTQFTINTNSSTPLTGGTSVWWIAVKYNS